MNLEEQVRHYNELCQKIEELEKQRKALSLTIMQQMQSSTLKLAGFTVKRISRISVKLTLEEARVYHAVKVVETIDKDKIKTLYNSGHPIDGVSETQYIQVSKSG